MKMNSPSFIPICCQTCGWCLFKMMEYKIDERGHNVRLCLYKEKVGGLSFDECLISRAKDEVSTKYISSKSNRLLLIVNERKVWLWVWKSYQKLFLFLKLKKKQNRIPPTTRIEKCCQVEEGILHSMISQWAARSGWQLPGGVHWDHG